MGVHIITDGNLVRNGQNGDVFMVVDNNYYNISKPQVLTGNTFETLVQGEVGKKIIVKGITVTGDGDGGVSTMERENETQNIILPVYHTKSVNTSTSNALNLELDENESVKIRTVGRAAGDVTFFGVSYRIIEI